MPTLRAQPEMRTRDLLGFIVGRHEIYRRKKRGEPKPWTDDAILQRYRFCNMYRELDSVTEWIAENWRNPNSTDPDLGFALIVARWVNWHPTLAELGFPVPWNADRFLQVIEDRRQRPEKTYTSAYRPPSPRAGGSRAEYQAAHLTGIWKRRKKLRRMRYGTLAQAHGMLIALPCMGSFLAGQVVADLKYARPLRNASDWWTWACPGPGSKRGLNRVLNRSVEAPCSDHQWFRALQRLHKQMVPLLRKAKMPRMHAQDLQNCLCEFDKYERVRLGEGKPKQRYPGV